MWQLFALGSLLLSGGESVIDKYALAVDRKIDLAVATFWRLFLFSSLTMLVGVAGWAGELHVGLNSVIVLLALFSALNSLCYTYLMWHIEVTEIGVIAYLAPFLFLGIDTSLLHITLSASEIAGIVLLVLGGVGFALDAKTHRIQKNLTPRVWAFLALNVLFTGALAYGFKYVHAAYGMNSVSFFASYGMLASAGLFALILYKRKSKLLLRRPALIYLPRIFASKVFDTASALLWAQALLLASVSQVSAMNALQPLVLFILTVIAQKILRMRVEERLETIRMEWKTAALCCLLLGGVLVS